MSRDSAYPTRVGNYVKRWSVFVAIGAVALSCLAQEDGRPGCTTILDEAKFGKPASKANKYNVSVLWRQEGNAITVKAKSTANGVGTSSTESNWVAVGVGWTPLQYDKDLYFRVNYYGTGYTLDVAVSELGSASCSWGQ